MFNQWEPLVATGASTHRSLVAGTSMCGWAPWAISHYPSPVMNGSRVSIVSQHLHVAPPHPPQDTFQCPSVGDTSPLHVPFCGPSPRPIKLSSQTLLSPWQHSQFFIRLFQLTLRLHNSTFQFLEFELSRSLSTFFWGVCYTVIGSSKLVVLREWTR